MLIKLFKQLLNTQARKKIAARIWGASPHFSRSQIGILREQVYRHPEDVESWFKLGTLLQQEGEMAEAFACFDSALHLEPEHFNATASAAGLASSLGLNTRALQLYEQAIEIEPSREGQIRSNMGDILTRMVRLTEAVACLERAVQLEPDLAVAHYNLACTLCDLGRTEEAEPLLRRAISLQPDFAKAHSTLLCLYGLHRNYDQQRLLDEHRRWADQHADVFLTQAPQHANSPEPGRRLRIGYVSADLREHSVSFFIEPILAGHDRSAFYVVCYDNWPEDDAVNQRLRGHADLWRKVHDLSDKQMEELIRLDNIDILIDLSGHTVGNRLLVFARKPAPVQATWFGYMCTTGLKAIDYRITDAYLDPPGLTEHFYVEKLVRISCAAAFNPAPESPALTAPPSLSAGHITFGSFNNYRKISDEVIHAWVRILNALPSSRLLLVALGGDDRTVQESICRRFAAQGLSGERIDVIGRRPLVGFFELLQAVDIALDPFPYSGGTTSLHTLWMGVPIIAMEGESELSKSTSGMLRAAGAPELVTQSTEDYVTTAIRLAENASALIQFRRNLRDGMAQSPILQGQEVVQSLEKSYRDMWLTWCVQKCPAGGVSGA